MPLPALSSGAALVLSPSKRVERPINHAIFFFSRKLQPGLLWEAANRGLTLLFSIGSASVEVFIYFNNESCEAAPLQFAILKNGKL